MTAKTMPRRILAAAILSAFSVISASAEAVSFDVASFGAKGDGIANDAAAINEAIAAASAAGGGTVEFGAGTYLSGSIHLESDVALHLDGGATIVASPDGEAYDKPEPNEWGDVRHYQDGGHSHWHDSLIWGEDLVNVSITGTGRIFGKGLSRGWAKETSPQNVGNKAIALRNCRNVLLRDFTIEHGGWFGILATGVDNLVIDGLKIDTNRDGMDIDCCHNVRISNCSVNSPWDDGICLKSSFGLGRFRSTENVTISDCLVSGYDEGSLLDGSRRHADPRNPQPTGRIKFGTESNGGFQAITITNCIFECCRGLALETVDGALLEDVTISNIAMRHIFSAPIFLRLGERMRGPADTPVGKLRHVLISNVVAEDVRGGQAILISGVKGHPIESVTLDNIQMEFAGGESRSKGPYVVPELEHTYPEPGNFGPTTSWALFARHVVDLTVRNVVFRRTSEIAGPAVYLDDVHTVELDRVKAPVIQAKTDWWQAADAEEDFPMSVFLAERDVDGLVVESGSPPRTLPGH
jgi:polygalacturonase